MKKALCVLYQLIINLSLSLKSINKWWEGMGVKHNIDSILRSLKEQPPAIHDVKLKSIAENLYESLNDGTRIINPHNKGIFLEPLLRGNILVKIAVYPKTVHIDIGCTFQPYPYSYGGAIELRNTLDYTRQFLMEQSQNKANIPPVGKWLITQYHFGKDGMEELAGRDFEHTWEELEGGMMRLYSKLMRNGRKIARLEQIRIPNRTVDEETELMAKPMIQDL